MQRVHHEMNILNTQVNNDNKEGISHSTFFSNFTHIHNENKSIIE